MVRGRSLSMRLVLSRLWEGEVISFVEGSGRKAGYWIGSGTARRRVHASIFQALVSRRSGLVLLSPGVWGLRRFFRAEKKEDRFLSRPEVLRGLWGCQVIREDPQGFFLGVESCRVHGSLFRGLESRGLLSLVSPGTWCLSRLRDRPFLGAHRFK